MSSRKTEGGYFNGNSISGVLRSRRTQKVFRSDDNQDDQSTQSGVYQGTIFHIQQLHTEIQGLADRK
jgi:hypothetical protein